MWYKTVEWVGLYVLLVLTSALTYTLLTGIPFWEAVVGALTANAMKVPICKIWHYLFPTVKECQCMKTAESVI